MKSHFYWERPFDSKLLLSKFAKIRKLDNGSASFDSFEYHFWLPVLTTAVRAHKSVGSLKAASIRKAVGDPSIDLLDSDAFLSACEKALANLRKRTESKFVMYATVTYAGAKLFNWIADGDTRIYWQPSERSSFLRKARQSRQTLKLELHARKVPDETSSLTVVLVHVTAHDFQLAVEKAGDSLDRLRAMLNLFVNSNRTINPFSSLAVPHAINKFRRGPLQTIHKLDGSLASEMFWYEPRWQHDGNSAQFKDEGSRFQKNLRQWWSKLRNNPLDEMISDAMLRYCRALDSHEADATLLGLWQVLERITGTDKYDVLIQRIVRLFKDRDDTRQVANHIRVRRNQTVHAGYDITHEADAILLQAETLASQAIFFCLKNGDHFADQSELCEFLDLTLDESKLKRRQELVNFFIAYQNR